MIPAPTRAPDLDDDFRTGPDPRVWITHYLPHWTTPDRSAARWQVAESGLELRIEADQLDWRPEDAPLRVSNLQTGTWSGPSGSDRGTHRHRPDGLTVRSPQDRLLFTPSAGRIDVTLSASADPDCMTAIWLVGTEQDGPQDAGELCVAEIDADALGERTRVRTGIKAHHDPRLRTEMTEVDIPLDARRPHTWTVIWGDGRTVIGCEGQVVGRFDQAPDYPLVLLIDIFEIGPPRGHYPKSALLHRVQGWSGD